jgi:hypothetical protein
MTGNVKSSDADHVQRGDKRRQGVGDATSHRRLVPHKMWAKNKIIECSELKPAKVCNNNTLEWAMDF